MTSEPTHRALRGRDLAGRMDGSSETRAAKAA